MRLPFATKASASVALVGVEVAGAERRHVAPAEEEGNRGQVASGPLQSSVVRLYVVLPNRKETFTGIVGESEEEFAEDAAKFLGLA